LHLVVLDPGLTVLFVRPFDHRSRFFAELRTRMSPEAQARTEADAQRLGEEMDLGEVRRALKLSQNEIRQTLEIGRGGRKMRRQDTGEKPAGAEPLPECSADQQ
jgi:hypothetical protein